MLVNDILLHLKRDDVEKPKGSVIITHGIAEHSGRYEEMTKLLNEQGFNVVRYDIRGHGQSQGPRGKLKSFHQTIDDLHVLVLEEKKLKPKKLFLLGHSMGGLIVNMYAVKYGQVDGIISSAASSYFIKDVLPLRIIPHQLLGWVPKKSNFADDQLSRIREVEDAYIQDPLNLKVFYISIVGEMMVSGVRYLNKNLQKYNLPVLFMHGGNDKIVPAQFSQRLYQSIPSKDKSIKIYDGAYHEIFNDLDKEKAFEDLIKWLLERS
jgi:acylglycerol lipase